MKLLNLALAVSLLGCLAVAQGARYDSISSTITGGSGGIKLMVALPDTQIYVCTGVYTGTACAAPGNATVYSDVGLTTPITQPIVADAGGNFGFYFNPSDAYTVTEYPPTGTAGTTGSFTIASSGGAPVSFETNGTANGSQSLLNLVAGTNVTLTNSSGAVTIDASGGGGGANNIFTYPKALVAPQLTQPTAPTVTAVGGTGTTWTYEITELYNFSPLTDLTGVSVSTEVSDPTSDSGGATLSGTVYNTVSATCQFNGDTINVYRTAVGSSPTTTGLIKSLDCTADGGAVSFNDTGLAGDSTIAPTVNTTGTISAPGEGEANQNEHFGVGSGFSTGTSGDLIFGPYITATGSLSVLINADVGSAGSPSNDSGTEDTFVGSGNTMTGSTGTNTVIGAENNINGSGNSVLGTSISNSAASAGAVAVGGTINFDGSQVIAIGNTITADTSSIVIGGSASGEASNAIAIGNVSSSLCSACIALGNSAVAATAGEFAVAANFQLLTHVVFATLPTCTASLEGAAAFVTDSTTNTWGDTVTGSGSDPVMTLCDGTNWTVMGK